MSPSNPSPRIRSLAIAAVLFNVGGNYFLSVGMRDVGETVTLSLAEFVPVFANLWILLGVAMLAFWLVAQLSLLSLADLTFVLPITSLSYVLTAAVGAILLRESVSLAHWAGILMIFAGVLAVGRTRPRTVPARRGAVAR